MGFIGDQKLVPYHYLGKTDLVRTFIIALLMKLVTLVGAIEKNMVARHVKKFQE